jgi:hypothetical protein
MVVVTVGVDDDSQWFAGYFTDCAYRRGTAPLSASVNREHLAATIDKRDIRETVEECQSWRNNFKLVLPQRKTLLEVIGGWIITCDSIAT